MPDEFPCLRIQESPDVLVAVIPGSWLLKRTTPSWRITDPDSGFQRVVNEERAQDIAATVLDQHRTFPNAIVLATDKKAAAITRFRVSFSRRERFLVVDGQHRLWAQKFSDFDAPYCCLIHLGLSERQMAALFVEINDNQKRVPSSLRWDLVRLVRADEDSHEVRAVDLVYALATKKRSALFQRIDLTGEQRAISLKQGSVAPAIRSAISARTSILRDEGYEIQLRVLMAYVAAIRECDADAWDSTESPLYGARVFRALFRLFPEIAAVLDSPMNRTTAKDFFKYLHRINLRSLDPERIRAQQGAAGIKAIYDTIREQVFKSKK